MSKLIRLAVFLFLLGATGCNAVVLDAPIGEPLTRKEKSIFVGEWVVADNSTEILYLRLNDSNELIKGKLEWDAALGQFKVESNVLDCRRVGSAIYCFEQLEGEPTADSGPPPVKEVFGFVRVEPVSDVEFKLYLPDSKNFKAAVESGKLRGFVEEDENNDSLADEEKRYDVLVRANSESIEEVFGSKDISAWFDTENSTTHYRLDHALVSKKPDKTDLP